MCKLFFNLEIIVGIDLTRMKLSLFAIGYENHINIFDINSEKSIKTLAGHTKSIEFIIRISNIIIASAANDLTVKVWDIINRTCLTTLYVNLTIIYFIIKLNKNQIACGSGNGVIKVMLN